MVATQSLDQCLHPTLNMSRFPLSYARAYWCANCEKTVVIDDLALELREEWIAGIFSKFGEGWKQLIERAKEI